MITNEKIPIEVIYILNQLKQLGYKSYLVGGAVRDLILDQDPKDFDICTAARPSDVKLIFEKVINTGEKFGTVTVLCEKTGIQVRIDFNCFLAVFFKFKEFKFMSSPHFA